MVRIFAVIVAALLAGWLHVDEAAAQRTTQSGAFGARTLGSGITSGGQGLGGGNRSRGGQGLGAGAGSLGQERLGRGERRGFIGADRSDVADFIGAFQDRTANATPAPSENRPNNRDRNRNRGSDRPRTMIRVQYHIAFAYPTVSTSDLGRQLRDGIRVLNEASRARGYSEGTAAVALDGQTATLRGVVASEYDRLVAEKMALLEPGVARVENQLRVVPPKEGSAKSLWSE